MIGVSPVMLERIVKSTPITQSILIAGDHGIGKSSIVRQISKKENRVLIEIFLGQMNDRGDLVGPSVRIGEKKFGFLDPTWWPEEGVKYNILLDELNRAEQDLHSPIFDFVLNGCIMGRTLPNWGDEENGPRIFAAVNSGDDYFVSEMDPALKDRFNMYRLEVSVKDWIKWAREEKLNNKVISYIEKHDNHLTIKAEGNERGATPRGWHRVSSWLNKNSNIQLKDERLFAGIVFEGIIGGVSSEFVKYCISSGLTASDILRIPLPTINQEMHDEQWENVLFEISTYPASDLIALNEQMVSATIGLDRSHIETYCKNLYIYSKWLLENEKKEVATSLYQLVKDSTHAKKVFYCDIELMMFFTETLDNLNVK